MGFGREADPSILPVDIESNFGYLLNTWIEFQEAAEVIERKKRAGLIVNISFFAAQRDDRGVAYGVAKAASDRTAAGMAHELREYNVAAVSRYPASSVPSP